MTTKNLEERLAALAIPAVDDYLRVLARHDQPLVVCHKAALAIEALVTMVETFQAATAPAPTTTHTTTPKNTR